PVVHLVRQVDARLVAQSDGHVRATVVLAAVGRGVDVRVVEAGHRVTRLDLPDALRGHAADLGLDVHDDGSTQVRVRVVRVRLDAVGVVDRLARLAAGLTRTGGVTRVGNRGLALRLHRMRGHDGGYGQGEQRKHHDGSDGRCHRGFRWV